MKKNNRWVKAVCLCIASMFVITAILGASILSPSAASVTTCDVNCDGIVNGKDFVRVLKYIQNSSSYPYDASVDVNLDGVISRKDIIAMRSFVGETYDITALQYVVCDPANSVRYGTYTTLDEAKAYADSKSHLGYVVFDSLGKFLYSPTDSLVVSKILWNAKYTADYVRVNGYTYGDAKANPYYDRTEKVVSCDRFVGFALANAGYLANQPATRGVTLFGTNNDLGTGSVENFCISHGFVKITSINDVKAGDIIFVGYSTNDMGLAAQYRHYPKHVFIAASGYTEGGGYTYRYDCGSVARIQSVQPFYEALETANNEFRFAYRPTK